MPEEKKPTQTLLEKGFKPVAEKTDLRVSELIDLAGEAEERRIMAAIALNTPKP